MTAEQALGNLHRAAEKLPCDGDTRDALRASAKVLQEAITELAAFKADRAANESDETST